MRAGGVELIDWIKKKRENTLCLFGRVGMARGIFTQESSVCAIYNGCVVFYYSVITDDVDQG